VVVTINSPLATFHPTKKYPSKEKKEHMKKKNHLVHRRDSGKKPMVGLWRRLLLDLWTAIHATGA
jgi:hypothetical protein